MLTNIICAVVVQIVVLLAIGGLSILRAAALGDADAEERAKELQAQRACEIFCTPLPDDKPKRFLDEGVHYCTCCGNYWIAGAKTTWTVLPAEYFCEDEKLCDPCCHSIAGQEVARREA